MQIDEITNVDATNNLPNEWQESNALENKVEKVAKEAFIMHRDTAQYKGSSYANVVRVERNISLDKAFDIAGNDPKIGYFFYVKGQTMVLEIPKGVSYDKKDPLVSNIGFRYDSGQIGHGAVRLFHHGDTVFFGKEGMWLGSAPGLSDTYVKP